PASGESVVASDLRNVDFVLEPSAGVVGYSLQLATDSRFGDVVYEDKSTTAFFSWRPKATGTYYWRVNANDRFGRVSRYSQPRKLLVRAGAAEPILPAANQAFLIDSQDFRIAFQWSKTAGSGE